MMMRKVVNYETTICLSNFDPRSRRMELGFGRMLEQELSSKNPASTLLSVKCNAICEGCLQAKSDARTVKERDNANPWIL